MVLKYQLDEEMENDLVVIGLLSDKSIAEEFYRAITNMRWVKQNVLPDDEAIMEKLMGIDTTIWSVSWRGAGAIVAEIRNKHYSVNEDYMDFYCCGSEGTITDRVMECFNRMGWKPKEWEYRV